MWNVAKVDPRACCSRAVARFASNWATTVRRLASRYSFCRVNTKKFVDSPKKIEKTDATTIQKLLTTHSRKNRFCEGHLAAMFEKGHIVALEGGG